MASAVLKCAIFALLVISFVVAQRGSGGGFRPIYPEGHPPRNIGRQEFIPSGKAGHCPPTGGRPTSRYRTCRRDEDCPGLDKCCSANGRYTCVPAIFA